MQFSGILNKFTKTGKVAIISIAILLGIAIFIVIAIRLSSDTTILEQQSIKFATSTVDDETKPIGEQEVVTKGEDGLKELTYKGKVIFGLIFFKELVNTVTIREPITQVSKNGIIQISNATATEPIPYESITKQGGTGLTSITQQGVNGVRTINYRVKTLRGAEISREVVSSSVTKAPISQITTLGRTTCRDVTSYDYNWNNDMLCTRADGSQFYTNYAGARAATQ